MELDLAAQDFEEDENYSLDLYNQDYLNCEGERCGICMDVVIDRGVLDCCQHWFCFTCIDNWATITNLCPLCQNEFQMITCVPVYDTIGSNKTDEDANSRDDSWSIDGRNSFPSYYIDENAVVCLGDGCTIRSGLVAVGEDSNLDTSIACDVCDKWYHAFCVEFDTENSCQESWLCPRCLILEAPEKSDRILIAGPTHDLRQDASGQCIVGSDLVGKVLVSVADVGETALVVSMVEGEKVKESVENPSSVDLSKDIVIDGVLSDSITNFSKLESLPCSGSTVEPNLRSQGLELSLLQNTFLPSTSSSCSNPIESTHLMTNADEKITGELRLLDGLQTFSRELSAASSKDAFLQSGLDLHLALSANGSSAVDMKSNESEKSSDCVQLQHASKEYLLPVDMVMDDKKEIITALKMPSDKGEMGSASGKRKHSDRERDDGERKVDNGAEVSVKRGKTEGKSQHNQSKVHAEQSKLKVSNVASNSTAKLKASNVAFNSTAVTSNVMMKRLSQRKRTVNVMDIVPEMASDRPTQLSFTGANTSSKEKGSASGLRVKKILRRANDDENTSSVVQTLRQEIKDAVRNKSSKEVGENHFNPKLLAAFRAVVARQTSETKNLPVDLKAKKLLLHKGKVRENLTKKIYSVGGKRRGGWVRDCDIEFWKYRCTQVSKPEKVQTLKSVLDLLKNDSDDKTECQKDVGTKDVFLSRLYIADASVVPRKSDIKPVSVHDPPALSERSEELTKRTDLPSSRNHCDSSPSLKHEGSSCKVFSFKGPAFPSSPGTSKVSSQKKLAGNSDDTKSDKRKWALELLARKTAVVGRNSTHEKEDNAMLKGNYPLLAQLPKDMRPELAPTRHNKIPASVRQAQLYRLAEHLIKKANVPVIRRAAETELAIADAINIEKEIANRSNSKPVYVNLCSQEIRRKSASATVEAIELNPTSAPEILSDNAKENGDHCNELEGDDALRAAGLLSDSPPSSPLKEIEDSKEDIGLSEKIEDDGPDNVFEVESHPDLDIYGDFEYNLEDDDLIGAYTFKISKPQTEDPKIKVLLSTLNNPERLTVPEGDLACEKSVPKGSGSPSRSSQGDLACEISAHKGSGSPSRSPQGDLACEISAPQVSESPSSSSKGGSAVDVRTESDVRDHTKDEDEEQCLAECDIQELYGPDKELLIRKYPETASMIPREPLLKYKTPGHMVDNERREISKEDNGNNMKDNEDAASHSKRSENSSDKEKASTSETRKSETVLKKDKEDARSKRSQNTTDKEKTSTSETSKSETVLKKVEAYIKEHVRPLCKSGVITVDQYRWAVGKTTEKVMKFHSRDKNANFLIKEGDKVKKLAEQYVEAAQQNPKDH